MNFWEEEEEKEKGKPPPTEDHRLLFSSSSNSDHHQNNHHQPPYRHPCGGGWLLDGRSQRGEGEGGGEGEPSSRFDPMTVDSSLVSVTPVAGGDGGGGGGEEESSGMAVTAVVEREHMFDKAVTPSDVGKLNRLVIPKQHAERYFPLDSSNNDKGLLLNFEDRNGKLWRFRYSYWNSSQSYVMTKGWSRFVKEKKLDAGDIVSFQRGVGVTGKDRLFIDWRRRLDAALNPPPPPYPLSSSNLSFPLIPHQNFPFHTRSTHPWNPLVLQSHPALPWRNPNLMPPPTTNNHHSSSSTYTRGSPYGSVVNVNKNGSRSVIYFGPDGYCRSTPQHPIQMTQMQQRRGIGVGIGIGIGIDPPPPPSLVAPPIPPVVTLESLPPVLGKASGKRLRLFGVNMDFPLIEEEDDQDGNPQSELNHDHNNSPPLIPPSSSSTIPYVQLRPNGGETECNQSTILSPSSSSAHDFNIISKSTTSTNMSLDLDI